ncbi:hypothetical protein CDAR_612401 [Caerostris darwini]|uniref:Uncharacterized protein n=1 Tax=Caerostris darwini TaxID=1538125 RepID=A0AAV4SI05_9ARAC|nr:hypothetical protein CDAR_612401 [Caerostris darwini]
MVWGKGAGSFSTADGFVVCRMSFLLDRTTPPSIANQKRRKDKNPISNAPLRLYLLNTILQKRKSSLSRTIQYHPTNNISDPTTHTPEREDGEQRMLLRITADPFPPLQQKRRPVLVTHHLH